jgi:phosphoribosylformimino-5-aminoimidazole carboxamide ribonucleotide (ProFAR) isomerase
MDIVCASNKATWTRPPPLAKTLAQMALNWVAKGARRLHLVDSNGAFAGKPQNNLAIKAI